MGAVVRQRSHRPHRHDPKVYLRIGQPAIRLTTSQSLLTKHSRVLSVHLHSQVPDVTDYKTRDKEMNMRNESPNIVGRFLKFIKTGQYPITTLEKELRVLAFALKYEVPDLALYSKSRAMEMARAFGADEGWFDNLLDSAGEEERSVLEAAVAVVEREMIWNSE